MSATPLSTSGLMNSARWRRSSRSTGMNNCVEAAALSGGLLAVRDSKRTDGPAVLFTELRPGRASSPRSGRTCTCDPA